MRKNIIILFSLLYSVIGFAQDENVQIIKPDSIITYNAITTTIQVHVFGNVVVDHYVWNLYGDGTVILNTNNGIVSYSFTKVGKYNTSVSAVDINGRVYSSGMYITVLNGTGTQIELPLSPIVKNSLKSGKVGEGVCTKYAIIINGASDDDPLTTVDKEGNKLNEEDGIYSETNDRINDIYKKLKLFGYTDANIYYLNGRFGSKQPTGADDVANKLTLQNSFTDLAKKIDDDDYLFFWAADHGHGYFLPSNFDIEYHPGDVLRSGQFACRINALKKDMLEKDVKCRPFMSAKLPLPSNTKKLNNNSTTNYTEDFLDVQRFPGLNKWFLKKIDYYDKSDGIEKVKICRAKYLSNFNFMRFDGKTIIDSDPFIELIVDYPIVTDANGIMTKTAYDTYNKNKYNGAFSYITTAQKGTFQINILDETKWQHNYTVLIDNICSANEETFEEITFHENQNYIKKYILVYDKDANNTLDIAFTSQPINLNQINQTQLINNIQNGTILTVGTDTDNDGMIDGVDFNENSSKNDYVGFDESISLGWDPLYSNDLATYLNNLSCKYMTVGIMSCFSGGFIQDISEEGRVVLTATQKYYWGFLGDFAQFGLGFSNDANKDGNVTMNEVYNYARLQDNSPLHLPQYDDNGDGTSQNQLITGIFPGDGCLGSKSTLNGLVGSQTIENTTLSGNLTISSPTVTVSNVTVPNSKILTIEAVNTSINTINVELGATLIIDTNIINQCQ